MDPDSYLAGGHGRAVVVFHNCSVAFSVGNVSKFFVSTSFWLSSLSVDSVWKKETFPGWVRAGAHISVLSDLNNSLEEPVLRA